MLRVTETWCEHEACPLGLGVRNPRVGWRLESDRTGVRQVAYLLKTAATREDLATAAGTRVESDASAFLPAGVELSSRQRVWWQVEVWDNHGDHAVSEPAWFEAGLLEPGDWSAEWIQGPRAGGPRTAAPIPCFERTVRVDGPVARARLYCSALGIHEVSLDGERVGTDTLSPGWTEYRKRVQVETYDVTDRLTPGEHTIHAIVADGWYCGHVEWRGRELYGDRPRFLGQLEIEYADGRTERIATGPGWRVAYGPILEADLLQGQSVDARQDWGPWTDAETFSDPGIARVMRHSPPCRPQETLKPVEIISKREWNGTRYIFDLGQNMVGRVRLRLGKAPAGHTVVLRHAEVLDEKGELYTINLRTAKQTDVFTCRGEGEEVFEPTFTFHGFRYVEVKNYPGEPTLDDLQGIVVHSDLPVTGTFECSEPLLNQLQHNIEWGWKGNSVDIPTDCPQRDERLGWTGDAQVFVRTAAFLRDVRAFFLRWQQDLEDAQGPEGQIPAIIPNTSAMLVGDGGPAWADAVLICPWTIYRCYGDAEILRRHFASMRAYVGYLEASAKDWIRSDPAWDGFHGFGDWLNINAETPNEVIGTAFLAHSAELLAKVAAVLGEPEAEQAALGVHAQAKAAFQRRFVTPEGRVFPGTQTAYLLALHFGLLEEGQRAGAARELVRDIRKRGNHLSTGFVGSPYLNPVLSEMGHLDVAYDLLNQKGWPSWLYAVTQGATTIWERWDGWTHDKGFQDPSMNSFNHYAYGAIGMWLYQTVAGLDLDPEVPGYRRVRFAPRPGGGLSHASATLKTVYGPTSSLWRLENGTFRLEVTLPPNTTGRVSLPSGAEHEVGSGRHTFEEPG